MTIDLTDTSTGAIHEALTQARRRMGGPASGTVLTLLLVTAAPASDTPRDMLLGLAKAYQPGDTDLSWTRSTSWRSLLAATLDQPYPELIRGEVLGEPDNPSADLIAAWLGTRLGIEVQRRESDGPGITEVSFETADGQVSLSRPDGRNATLAWPGRPERPVAPHRRQTPDLS